MLNLAGLKSVEYSILATDYNKLGAGNRWSNAAPMTFKHRSLPIQNRRCKTRKKAASPPYKRPSLLLRIFFKYSKVKFFGSVASAFWSPFQDLPQWRKLLFDHQPYQLEIKSEIVMNQDVAKTGDGSPVNAWVLLFKSIAEALT